jgi:hypothetical protein
LFVKIAGDADPAHVVELIKGGESWGYSRN